MTSEYFQGPIVHPKHLREYEDILPGAAERIINMAEKQQCHEHEMEKTIVTKTLYIHKWAMILGFFAFIILISIAVFVGMKGNNILAGMLLTTAVLGGATTLIRGRGRMTKTSSEK